MLRLLMIAACALAVGGGFAVAASSPPRDKAAALQRLGSVGTTDSSSAPVAPPDSAPRPIPARMLGPGTLVPIPPSVLRVRNGWLASDGRNLVAVYAGSAGDDSSVGRLVVVRQNLASGVQTVRIVDAGATGALAITAAPLGTVGRLEKVGSLALRTDSGGRLRLGLGRGGTLTRSSRSAATVAPPKRPRSSDQVSHPSDR
jgi:hypothetical protein